jgi:hypothetical protein
LIADLATGRPPRADIAVLTPDRFPPLNQPAAVAKVA